MGTPYSCGNRVICGTCQYYLSTVNIEEVEYPKGDFFISVTTLGYGSCLFDNSHTNSSLNSCKNHLHYLQSTFTEQIWIEVGIYPTANFDSRRAQ